MPSLEYDDPMRMPKLHALPVLQRKDSFSSRPSQNLNSFFFFLLYMYELYSVCASLLCKSQKMMKQNIKDDEALRRGKKPGGIQIIKLPVLSCSQLLKITGFRIQFTMF